MFIFLFTKYYLLTVGVAAFFVCVAILIQVVFIIIYGKKKLITNLCVLTIDNVLAKRKNTSTKPNDKVELDSIPINEGIIYKLHHSLL